jgi:hypothetical protein
VLLPTSISLAPDKDLEKGRIRVGIVNPREIRSGKCKIYGSAKSYPELYPIKIVVYGFGKDGAITARDEKTAELRCERIR